MIPNMYKMAGELLPSVIHVSARSVAAHALSIFNDHGDVYACRQTGYAMLASNNPQQVMDLGAVAHLAAIEGRVPYIHFFDGFRTSHEVQKIETWDYSDLEEMLNKDAVSKFRRRALNPEHPTQRGTAQNPDIFFQAKESANPFYDAAAGICEAYMNKVNAKLGTNYKLFNYYGSKTAENVIIAMGSACDTCEETIDYLNANGSNVGVLEVHLYRPFSIKHLLATLPDSVKKITVLDKTKEPGAIGEPLFLDVVAALKGTKFDACEIFGGRYGLGSKDTTPAQIAAVYTNMASKAPKKQFTVGIEDDVTNLSLTVKDLPDVVPQGTTSCKFWGLGADGTVGANKNSIKIIGDNTDMYAQGYFSYDSKKSGGITVSHLRFGKDKIRSPYLVSKADFVACHNPSYMDKYSIVQDLKEGGTFLLNCAWTADELDTHLPGDVKAFIANNKIKMYTIDATHIAKELGLGGRVNTILQAAFFKLSKIIPVDSATTLMKEAAKKSYGKKGDAVVQLNYNAIDAGIEAVKEFAVPAAWSKASGAGAAANKFTGDNKKLVDYVNNMLTPINAQHGDDLPVSAFVGEEDGTFPMGSSAYEKRGIAVDVPAWKPENCIQCNFCAYVCPHAVCRPVAMNAAEVAAAPKATLHKPMTAVEGLEFGITISTLDCTGCGSCANVCPGMKGEKALVMQPLDTQLEQAEVFAYAHKLPEKPEVAAKFAQTTVKGSQFKLPMLEFSGACAGCGETPYAKLATQLFGDRMYIANATGCSSIWGGSAPATPYCTNAQGKGPTWANSLFEDNAEYGYGMLLANNSIRSRLQGYAEALEAATSDANLKTTIKAWIESYNDGTKNSEATDKFIAALEANKESGASKTLATNLLADSDYLRKKSVWVLGGDGWAYDIGFGGLDHVLASGDDINVLVFDTEVYSNTGGQASKASPRGAIAQFAAGGKSQKKKDFASIAMSYGYVYVAQVSQGADYNQCLKAFHEAESYNGPSIILAYAPCINHGIKGGMGLAQTEEKRAVESGYWHLFRFDPRKEQPFTLDSKAPTKPLREFLESEIRYSSLLRANPDRANMLFDKAVVDAEDRYTYLSKLAALYNN